LLGRLSLAKLFNLIHGHHPTMSSDLGPIQLIGSLLNLK
jgi:hypothetical protein